MYIITVEGSVYIIIIIITDFNDMQKFIEVALDTTDGEGDEIQDRLSCLSDLCGKFSPIIFKLEVSVQNLQSLLKLFRDTWDLMKSLKDPISTVVSFSPNKYYVRTLIIIH